MSNAHMAALVTRRSLFRVLAIDPEKDTAVIEDQVGCRIETPRTLDQFYGGTVELHVGQIISAIVTGEYERISDVLDESNSHDRPDFDDSPAGQTGWCPYSNPPKDAGKQ